jgi:hypothetical protein
MADDFRALCAELADTLEDELNFPDPRALELIARARAALAVEAVGPSDEGLDALWDDAASYFALYDVARDFARAVLARWGRPADAPRPIPVAERLPTEADCDAEGRCWFLSPRFLTWSLETPPVAQTRGIGRFFWLPAAAIPLPEA